MPLLHFVSEKRELLIFSQFTSRLVPVCQAWWRISRSEVTWTHSVFGRERKGRSVSYRNTNFSTEQILPMCLHLASTPMKSKSATLMHLLFVLFKKDLHWDHALLLTGLDLYARYKQILNLCLRIL